MTKLNFTEDKKVKSLFGGYYSEHSDVLVYAISETEVEQIASEIENLDRSFVAYENSIQCKIRNSKIMYFIEKIVNGYIREYLITNENKIIEV